MSKNITLAELPFGNQIAHIKRMYFMHIDIYASSTNI